MAKYILKIFLLSIVIISGGCSLDIKYENQFSDPDAITTPETGRELLADAYNSLPSPELDLALLTDDFDPTYWASRNPSLNNQYNWQPQPLLDMTASLWPEYYSVIATVNALLERLPDIREKNETERQEKANLYAEACTMKAYCYFQLLRLFAGNPEDGLEKPGIVLKEKVAMENLPRSSVGDCITEIRRLIGMALSTDATTSGTGWLTPDATLLLKAEVELYAGDYEEAAACASRLLDKFGYDTFSASVYSNLWDGSQCDERIFDYASPDRAASFYQGIVYDTSSGDYFQIPSDIANLFGDSDCRKEWALLPFSSSSLGEQIYIGKYNRLRKEKREIMFVNKMRLSAALFVAAQAWCLDGKNVEKAREALNRYLKERGAEEVTGHLTAEALLKEVLLQKHLEFLGEGERYFDLKRYRATLLKDVDSRIPTATDYRWLLPIPKEEYLYNDNMVQNPEWPVSSFN